MALTAFCRLYTTSHSSNKTKVENDQNLKKIVGRIVKIVHSAYWSSVHQHQFKYCWSKPISFSLNKKIHRSNFWVFFNIHLSVMLILCGLKMGLEMLLVGLLISITTSEIHQGTACNRKKGVVALLDIYLATFFEVSWN